MHNNTGLTTSVSSTGSSLTGVDANYLTHMQMWEEIRACNQGAKEVIKLVSNYPQPSYTMSCDGMRFDHLSGDLQLAAQNHAYNRNLANLSRRKEYWARGRFFNTVGKTVESFHGMIWNMPAEEDFSPRMTVIAENINGAGKRIDDMAKEITYSLLLTGRYGILSDMAGSERQPTAAEQDMASRQPKLITYMPENILKAYTMNGAVMDIRLREIAEVPDPEKEFAYKCTKFTRRLFINADGAYENALYNEKDELLSTVIPKASGKPFTIIPFVFYGSDANTPEYSKPPMFDLSHINLGHFVLDCDNRDNLHYHGQGMTIVTSDMQPYEFDERNPAGLDTGAKGKNMLKQGDDVKLLQLEATGAIAAEMERDQERMIQAGAQVVQSNSSTMTLGQKKIETGSSMSTLARISHNTSAGLEKNMEYLAMFAGSPIGDTYKVNSKFITDEMTPELLNVHLALVQGGVLPQTTLNESARQAGLTKKDDETIANDLLEEGSSLTGDSEEVALLKAELEALKAKEE